MQHRSSEVAPQAPDQGESLLLDSLHAQSRTGGWAQSATAKVALKLRHVATLLCRRTQCRLPAELPHTLVFDLQAMASEPCLSAEPRKSHWRSVRPSSYCDSRLEQLEHPNFESSRHRLEPKHEPARLFMSCSSSLPGSWVSQQCRFFLTRGSGSAG